MRDDGSDRRHARERRHLPDNWRAGARRDVRPRRLVHHAQLRDVRLLWTVRVQGTYCIPFTIKPPIFTVLGYSLKKVHCRVCE